MNASPSPRYDWAIGVLAKAFCTDNHDILTDRRLEYLCHCILQDRGGYGARDGLSVMYLPIEQALRFDCGTIDNAREVAELTTGARCNSAVAVHAPLRIARQVL